MGDSRAVMKGYTDKAAKAAAVLSIMDTEIKNKALELMAEAINKSRDVIQQANQIDLDKAVNAGKNQAFIDRLKLEDKRIDGMCSMLKEVAALNDPLGDILETNTRPNGIVIDKVRVPIGVIGIIYESRPNVTSDCIALCLKAGNSVILRGGSDAINSNKAIFDSMKSAYDKAGLVDGAFILVEDTSRELVEAMLTAIDGIDLIMPRGGESLIRQVVEKSQIPVIKHYKGICHVYVDSKCDVNMAVDICLNAKVQRPGVCNAMETMLVHKDIAGEFLPLAADKLKAAGVKLKGCAKTMEILGEGIEEVTADDYATEWLDLILGIRVVESIDEALNHIEKYGSHHSDAIVTMVEANGRKFAKRVDSAAVYVNASTRFTDGGEFGMGAEIGISTDKLHARGPMGLKELTTYKYVIHGTGQIRE